MSQTYKFLFLSLILLAGCSGKDDNHFNPSNCQGDTTFILNKKCEKIKWESLPVIMTFDENVPYAVKETAISASEVWEAATGKNYFEFDELNGRSKEDVNLITITPQSQWQGDVVKENAKTYWTSRGTLMQQTNLHINDRTFEPDANGKMADIFSIILHELGHVLGLAHDLQNRDSVMFNELGNGEIVRELNQVDIDRVNSLY